LLTLLMVLAIALGLLFALVRLVHWFWYW
jgi:hypothetical protein